MSSSRTRTRPRSRSTGPRGSASWPPISARAARRPPRRRRTSSSSFGRRARHPRQQPRRRQLDAVRGDRLTSRWAAVLQDQSHGMRAAPAARSCRRWPRAAAAPSSTPAPISPSSPSLAFMDYGTCKAGLLYLTKALAKQYAPEVRVNAVLPGTDLVAHVDAGRRHRRSARRALRRLDREAAVKRFLRDRQMPMGIGNPEDVAHAVVFLASPLAQLHHGRQPRHRRHHSRTHIEAVS